MTKAAKKFRKRLPPVSAFALSWQETFSKAKDKALGDLRDNGVPVYTVKDDKVVEVDPSSL